MREITKVMLKARVMCWQSSLQPPRLDARECAHAPATFLHTLASLSLSFNLSLIPSEALSQSVSLVHISSLSITDSSLSIIGVYLSPHHATMTIPY